MRGSFILWRLVAAFRCEGFAYPLGPRDFVGAVRGEGPDSKQAFYADKRLVGGSSNLSSAPSRAPSDLWRLGAQVLRNLGEKSRIAPYEPRAKFLPGANLVGPSGRQVARKVP